MMLGSPCDVMHGITDTSWVARVAISQIEKPAKLPDRRGCRGTPATESRTQAAN